MALVTISGYPCSGKTTRAHELKAMIESRQAELALSATGSVPTARQLKVVIVNDESLGIDKSAYDDSGSEKPARANLLSATIRSIAKDTIVLCDALNYIKGFRYQLYCAAREAGVRNLTVHVACPPPTCAAFNAKREPAAYRYRPDTLDNLVSRYEEPRDAVRWDSPLVVVGHDEGLGPEAAGGAGAAESLAGRLQGLRVVQGGEGRKGPEGAGEGEGDRGSAASTRSERPPPSPPAEKPLGSSSPDGGVSGRPQRWSPVADRFLSLVHPSFAHLAWGGQTFGFKGAVNAQKPRHPATLPNLTSGGLNALHVFDSTCSSLISAFLAALAASPVPDPSGTFMFSVPLPHPAGATEGVSVEVAENRKVTLAALQRFKRQYAALRKAAAAGRGGLAAQGGKEVAHGFADFISQALRT